MILFLSVINFVVNIVLGVRWEVCQVWQLRRVSERPGVTRCRPRPPSLPTQSPSSTRMSKRGERRCHPRPVPAPRPSEQRATRAPRNAMLADGGGVLWVWYKCLREAPPTDSRLSSLTYPERSGSGRKASLAVLLPRLPGYHGSSESLNLSPQSSPGESLLHASCIRLFLPSPGPCAAVAPLPLFPFFLLLPWPLRPPSPSPFPPPSSFSLPPSFSY